MNDNTKHTKSRMHSYSSENKRVYVQKCLYLYIKKNTNSKT